jgi:coatomer subunit beta
MPDAPDILFSFLEEENDHTCKRNAFAALATINPDKALEYLSSVFDSIANHDELLQLEELLFIRRDASAHPENKARYLRLIFDLLESSAGTVVYEAASALTALTNNPVAVKAAAAKFVDLAIRETDNNVKLIVLDRVDQLRKKNDGILEDLTMEILRVLSSPDLDVRKKALDIALELVTSKNVEEVVLLLKKELSKTVDEQYDKTSECKSLVAPNISPIYLSFFVTPYRPITFDQRNPPICNQAPRSRRERGWQSYGLHLGRQLWHIRCRCHLLCERSDREVPGTSTINRRATRLNIE